VKQSTKPLQSNDVTQLVGDGHSLNPRSIAVLDGIPVDRVTLEEAVDRIDQFVQRGRLLKLTHQVTTVNLEFLVNAQRGAALRLILQHADLTVADGMPVVWGSRLLQTRLVERVSGADLVPALAQRCAQKGYTMMFFGSAPGIAEKAAAQLLKENPQLIVTTFGGPLFENVDDMDPAAVDTIRAAQPDVVCVALGNPKQEYWINRYRHALGVPVLIGVGGTLDFLAGEKPRAPMWMQDTGTEWIYRLLREPSRLFQRYLQCFFYFPAMLFRQIIQYRRAKELQPMSMTATTDGLILRPGAHLDVSSHPFTIAQMSAMSNRDLTIDASNIDNFDEASVASLFVIRDLVSTLTLEGVSPQARRSLERRRVADAFLLQ